MPLLAASWGLVLPTGFSRITHTTVTHERVKVRRSTSTPLNLAALLNATYLVSAGAAQPGSAAVTPLLCRVQRPPGGHAGGQGVAVAQAGAISCVAKAVKTSIGHRGDCSSPSCNGNERREQQCERVRSALVLFAQVTGAS